MVCTVPYLGAYPHLRLARKHHLRYEIVLALAELHCGTSIDDPRIAEQINVFNNWQFHNHDASCELLTDVRIAAIHFQEQKDGLRGMDGAVL